MEDIQCIFCNRSSDQIVIEESGFKGRKCPQCGLIFISPRPTFSEILNLYVHNQARASAQLRIYADFIKRLYARHHLAIIKKYIRSGSLLEIGAGAGYFLEEAKKEGFEVYGIELNKVQANFINHTLAIPCEESPLDESSFDGRKFDIVYHCDVISHFYDPIAEFRKTNDKLSDNGILVFETGNLGDVEEKYYRAFTEFQYPDHLFFFGENNLKELLKLTGFELIKIYRYSILSELLISKMSKKVLDFIKYRATTRNLGTDSAGEVASSSIGGVSFKRLIKNAHGYFLFLVRYRIGYVTPKKGRPQTVIVIARKST